MVYTSVTAGGLTYEMWLPVMDGANKTMKALPYKYTTYRGEKTVEAMTMFDVNKTVMRCLVKNLAMFGLGLYIYAGEDLPQDIKEYVCSDCGKPVDSAMALRTHKAFGVHLCKECGLERSKKKEEG
jgi:DNA-directed RNA polymerase subunit RPC12/RpoP